MWLLVWIVIYEFGSSVQYEAMESTQFNGSSSDSPASHSPGSDLPSELLRAGWRKFYSKREQRHYYFNKFSNESLWDQPTVGVSDRWCDNLSYEQYGVHIQVHVYASGLLEYLWQDPLADMSWIYHDLWFQLCLGISSEVDHICIVIS